jgi:ABC-2 type transport system ATP-binding protein
MMIQTIGLSKKYGDLLAVDNVNLTVNNGQLFAFLGPNGAGKTTTIKMMVGLLKPTTGQVLIDGFDIQQQPLEAKARIGYVPDEAYLYDKLTAREFLRFIARLYRIDPKVADARAESLLDYFDLGERADELVQGYSHGMKQKVALAGALLHDPAVVFLDEPTVGLDPKSARQMKDTLRGLCSKGVTVFMSTHILEIAEQLADRVGIINQGRLIAIGTMDELRAIDQNKDVSLEDIFLRLTEEAEAEQQTAPEPAYSGRK